MKEPMKTDAQGPDRSEQKQILKRFIQITLGRLARIRQDLSVTQQIFLDALPVMLHSNHPEFPCFVSEYTPCGISKYQPSGAELQKVHHLAPGFTLQDTRVNKQQLLGLYITGDCGTLIESPQQNLIVWVCHVDNLAANEIANLNRKCDLIEEWAKSLDLKVKFRVFDSHFVASKKIDSQHYLELDLFYRTSVLVAGRIPLWWIIPPKEEQRYEQYASMLRHKNYVNDEDIIDFGAVTSIPLSEHVVNGIDLLSYSYQTPYETCIKQLVGEIYISEPSSTDLLSRQYKELVYNNKLDLDAVDPYVMVYDRIEKYLNARQEYNRLELIRRCFYYQIGKQLSQYTSTPSWQRKYLERLVDEWRWSKDKLKLLDARQQWRADKVKEERLELVRELTAGYRFLLEFTRKNREVAYNHINDIHILGRKLYSWYERKAGKVDLLNLDITPDLLEKNLYFCQVSHRTQTVWAVYAEAIVYRDTPKEQPIRRCESLVELVAWCYFNGVADASTKLTAIEGEHQLSDTELKKIFHTLEENLPLGSRILKPTLGAFNLPAVPTSLQFFINVAADPGIELQKKDGRSVGLANVLNIGGKRDYVVLNIETLLTNSWGEIICKRFQGPIALLNCINDFLQSVPPDSDMPQPQLNIHCFSESQFESTKKRMQELFRDLTACYYTGTYPSNTRYVLRLKDQFFIIQYENGKTHFKGARNAEELLKRLGGNQAYYSPIVFDRHALPASSLAAICPTMKKHMVQVYFQDNGNKTATVYISDERGSLLSYSQPFKDSNSLLNPLDTFIQSTLYRQSASEREVKKGLEGEHFLIETQVLYYEIRQEQKDVPPNVYEYSLPSRLMAQFDAFSVQAIAELGAHNKPEFNIYCDQNEFSAADWGAGLYPAIARFILSRRKSGENYPCYVSDLDMSSMGITTGFGNTQTIDYLRHKLEIDLAINDALNKQSS